MLIDDLRNFSERSNNRAQQLRHQHLLRRFIDRQTQEPFVVGQNRFLKQAIVSIESPKKNSFTLGVFAGRTNLDNADSFMATATGGHGIGRRHAVIVRHVAAAQGHLLQANTHLIGTRLRRLNIDELPLTRCV
jgi:hypothetical protein